MDDIFYDPADADFDFSLGFHTGDQAEVGVGAAQFSGDRDAGAVVGAFGDFFIFLPDIILLEGIFGNGAEGAGKCAVFLERERIQFYAH